MCVSNNFVEQQASEYSKKIQANSHYKCVKVVTNSTIHDGQELIMKVILEDSDGTLYSVVPNENGLRFAKKEITYRAYNKLENKDTWSF